MILSISIIIASKTISDAFKDVGLSMSSSSSNNENYELIVNDGWMYLYETNSGKVWKKADNDNPEYTWEVVKHFTE